MRLRQILKLCLTWGWVVLLTMLLSAASAFAVSKLQTPLYRSSVYINVWPARLDLGLQQTIKGLMRSFAATIQSREVALQVSMDLQLDRSSSLPRSRSNPSNPTISSASTPTITIP